jgi:uncharacterized integral membrane protein
MRLIRLLIACLCLALGLVVGALNHQPVAIDLGFHTLDATLGVSLLVALLLGALIGGSAVTASVVLPLRRRLRRAANATPIAPASRDGY